MKTSNVDDLLYGYLPDGAESMNSVLQQFMVGKDEHGILKFCRKAFQDDEDYRHSQHNQRGTDTERLQDHSDKTRNKV